MYYVFISLILLLISIFFTSKIIQNGEKDLGFSQVVIAMAFHVLMGCIYGYIFKNFYGGDDTWQFNADIQIEWTKLITHPLKFFTELLPYDAFHRNATFSDGLKYYLLDLEHWLLTKPLAFFYLLSHGNYYVNVVIFNFMTFWGYYFLYRLFSHSWPEKKTILFIAIFLFPPSVFWLSGLRSDGLLFLFTTLAFYAFNGWLATGRTNKIFQVLAGLCGLLIVRPMMLALIIPALITWWLADRRKMNSFIAILVIYGSCIIIFFGSTLLSAEKNLPMFVTNWQQEFMELHGTSYHPDRLTPTLSGFVKMAPEAIANSFLRPYLWEASGSLQTMAAIESLFVFSFCLYFLLQWKVYKKRFWAGLFPLILFIFTLYLFIGYIVPFPGAIIRYRIISELLLLCILISNARIFRIKKKDYIKDSPGNF